jgi:23S rRNA (cytosine1962-C5)-methyltransferase
MRAVPAFPHLAPLLDAIATMAPTTDACRLFHGRGGLHPGCEHWALDLYPPVLLLTSYQPVDDAELAVLQAALAERWATLHPGEPLNLVCQVRDEVRADTRLLCGQVPEPHVVSEAGARFQVHLLRGFNHGLFLDMAEGRRWVRETVAAQTASVDHRGRGIRVLNLFAYTCAFSVAALQAGATQVVNVDMAAGALNIGKRNHALNGLTHGASFLPHDVFSTWGKIGRSGPYDLIVLDPPSYQKGSFVAEKDYARLLRRLPDLLVPQGHALLCLNSPKRDVAFLQDLMAAEAPELRFVGRVPNPPVYADVAPERALKVLAYQAPPLTPSAQPSRI